MKWEDAFVFISSTFNDMHAERDYLVKEVFPELTEWCEERKIRLKDIDLRWGVTEEESNNSKTIETCLHHVDKSRPFFLCFLGQRRGWIPDFNEDINDETKDIYVSIDELDGRSATEIEIEHALLKPIHMFLNDEYRDCPPTKHSLFFFRNPSYVDQISDFQKLIYTNDSEGSEDKIELANDELAKTKEKIINRKQEEDAKDDNDESKVNISINEYSGEWDPDILLPELLHYDHDEARGRLTNFKCGDASLKDVIIEQLKEQLSIAFPENMKIESESELEKDLDQQEIFAYLNSEGFIPRPEYMQKLEDYVKNDSNKICLITAEAGYGKTMLLANFSNDFKKTFPEKRLYKRFCGASNLSSKTYTLWKSIIDEAGIDESVDFYPNNLDELKLNIDEILGAISDLGDSVIIIDAINQMPDGFEMLKWFDNIPDNLKLILSVKNNSDLENIIKRDIFDSFEIMELADESKKKLIKEYLKNYLKQLDDDQIDVICGFEGSKNPLFLKILLAELRIFGSFDQLKDEIKSFGDTPISAFSHVLERLENDERYVEGENIVPLIFSLLSTSRFGLSEEELVGIIKNQTSLSVKAIEDAVRLNLRQVRSFMTRKENRHDFFYESFKDATCIRYENEQTESNKILADYFKNKADPDNDYSFAGENLRPFNELPYHLKQSGQISGLEKTLSSYLFIKNKLNLSDIYNVIADYQLYESDVEDNPIELIGRALELSSPVLINHKDKLPEQLWARMIEIDDEIIQKLLTSLDENTDKFWMKSTTQALYSPKSPIFKRLKPEGKKYTSAIKITNDKKLILGSADGILSLYDMDENAFEVLEKDSSKIIKIILDNDEMLVARANGLIKKWDVNTQSIIKTFDKIDAQITDIYLSKTYNKIYASSHTGIYTINLEADELRKEDIEDKNYNQIFVPRRNESILVCDEKEVDGWDVYEMRKSYNQHHQHELSADEDIEGDFETKMDSSSEIRFMGLINRFLFLISENGQMKMWNTLKNSGSGESIDETFTSSLNDQFAQAVTVEDEKKIITISKMGLLNVWKIPEPRNPNFRLDTYENGSEKTIQTGIANPTAIDYYSDDENNWVIIGNDKNDINIVDLNKVTEETEHAKHVESVLSIKIDGNEMITASENGEIFTWDLNENSLKSKFSNAFRNNCVSYDYSQRKMVSAGVKFEKDGKKLNKLAVWNVGESEVESEENKREPIVDIAQNSSGIVYITKNELNINGDMVKLDADASTLTTVYDTDDVFIGFEDGKIAKYENGLNTLCNMNSKVTKIKTSGDKLIIGLESGDMDILDFKGNLLFRLEGHADEINNININNNVICTISKDNTMKLWDIETYKCLYTYFLDIYATTINIDDYKVVIGDTLGNVMFFNLVG